MRLFEKDCKINFIDNNDVLLGFDNVQSCCENFGWFYLQQVPQILPDLDSLPKELTNPPPNLENYSFDPTFFQAMEDGYNNLAAFKILDKSHPNSVIYLCLYNSHGGYYSRGFYLNVGGQTIKEGYV